MKRKQERALLTLAQWQATCEEIGEYAPDYYGALLSITPITLKQGNSPADTFIQFAKDQETTLKYIAKQLSPNTQKYCSTFIQLCYEALPSPTVDGLKASLLQSSAKTVNNPLILPSEVITTYVGRYLNRHTLSSLICTCRFFYNHKPLRDIRDSKPRIEMIITSKNYTLMLTSKKKLFAAGCNSYGQLGVGNTTAPHTFTETFTGILLKGETIQGTYAGDYHTLVLTSQGRLFACGRNRFGQLGIGNTTNQLTLTETCKAILFDKETIEEVYAGGDNTLILTSQGRLFACGYNEFGQLGIGNTVNQNTFTETLTGVLLKGETIQRVYYAEGNHTLVFTSQGRFFACGYNEFGQLGIGNTTDQSTFTETFTGVLLKGETIQGVYAGGHHILTLTSQSRLFACGCNGFGQIGIGNITDQSTFTETFTGVLLKGETIQGVYVGGNHTLVLTSKDRFFACGYNEFGQLGIGNTTDQSTFTETFTGVLLKGETIQGVYAGGNHTLVLTSKDRLFVCGHNNSGQLGLKDRGNLLNFTPCPLPIIYHSTSTEKTQSNEEQEETEMSSFTLQ